MGLLSPNFHAPFFAASLRDWVKFNLKKQMGKHADNNWHLIWGVTIWKLWTWRNSFIFEADFSKPPGPARVVLNSWKLFVQRNELSPSHEKLSADRRTKWFLPFVDWIKINVDGTMSTSNSRASCGGVLRDSNGSWIAGFCKAVGRCTVIEAETWAVYRGLQLARIWDSRR